jgi:acetyl coenzyme A synthetase (ADP forming)-like protein
MTIGEVGQKERRAPLLGWDVVLRNGSTVHIRPIGRDDEPRLLELFRHLSKESLYERFFSMRKPDLALIDSPAVVDYDHEFGLVAESGAKIVGVAHYFRVPEAPERAEVAFTIADELHGQGVGTRLLEKLAEVARARSVSRFDAECLESNRKMLDVFVESGFEVTHDVSEGIVRVCFPVERTTRFDSKVAERDQLAASASMKRIFEPRSIAVVGVSRKVGQLGAQVLNSLIENGFTGALYPVNPTADTIANRRAYAKVSDIPGEVDLAIVVVPAERVDDVIDDCVIKGVKGVVLITAGFSETGAEGREREHRIVEKVRSAGIRLVGPNCMGVINTSPDIRMQGTFASVFPLPGNIAMSTQSGALGLAILQFARRMNIGFSTFVSVGNKADVSGNDLIQYWAEDPRTDVILLYLESFGNPNRFAKIARRVARQKPIVAVKSGRSGSGARAASSHTGALASSDAIVDDLFRQAGVIRTDTLEELFDVASVLARQPLPSGTRVAILTNAGGPGILAADACESRGLELPLLKEETRAALRALLPAEASVGNPVDMIASASADQYRKCAELLLADSNVDALLVIYIPVLPTDAIVTGDVIRRLGASGSGKPIIATFMGADYSGIDLAPVPSFPFPERAAVALARAAKYAEWRRRPFGEIQKFADCDRDGVRAIVSEVLERGGGWLKPAEAARLLRAAGITVAAEKFVASGDDAVAAAGEIGYPVAMKAIGVTILHKSDVGGVRLSLSDETSVRAAYADLAGRFGSDLSGVLVQQMVPGGVEVMIGAVRDATFGHVLVYGAGGTLVELLSDVAFRLQPVSDADVDDMVEEVKCTRLLRGYRGNRPADEAGLKEVIQRLSALLEICPEIEEMDINPLKVMEKGAIVVDVRVRIEAETPKAPSRRIAY